MTPNTDRYRHRGIDHHVVGHFGVGELAVCDRNLSGAVTYHAPTATEFSSGQVNVSIADRPDTDPVEKYFVDAIGANNIGFVDANGAPVNHGFTNGEKIIYRIRSYDNGPATAIGGLVDGQTYRVVTTADARLFQLKNNDVVTLSVRFTRATGGGTVVRTNGGSWAAAGFAVGQLVHVTNAGLGNNGDYTITAVSGSRMTLGSGIAFTANLIENASLTFTKGSGSTHDTITRAAGWGGTTVVAGADITIAEHPASTARSTLTASTPRAPLPRSRASGPASRGDERLSVVGHRHHCCGQRNLRRGRARAVAGQEHAARRGRAAAGGPPGRLRHPQLPAGHRPADRDRRQRRQHRRPSRRRPDLLRRQLPDGPVQALEHSGGIAINLDKTGPGASAGHSFTPVVDLTSTGSGDQTLRIDLTDSRSRSSASTCCSLRAAAAGRAGDHARGRRVVGDLGRLRRRLHLGHLERLERRRGPDLDAYISADVVTAGSVSSAARRMSTWAPAPRTARAASSPSASPTPRSRSTPPATPTSDRSSRTRR